MTATACKSQEGVNVAQRVAIKGGGYPKEEGQSSEQTCHLARQDEKRKYPLRTHTPASYTWGGG